MTTTAPPTVHRLTAGPSLFGRAWDGQPIRVRATRPYTAGDRLMMREFDGNGQLTGRWLRAAIASTEVDDGVATLTLAPIRLVGMDDAFGVQGED